MKAILLDTIFLIKEPPKVKSGLCAGRLLAPLLYLEPPDPCRQGLCAPAAGPRLPRIPGLRQQSVVQAAPLLLSWQEVGPLFSCRGPSSLCGPEELPHPTPPCSPWPGRRECWPGHSASPAQSSHSGAWGTGGWVGLGGGYRGSWVLHAPTPPGVALWDMQRGGWGRVRVRPHAACSLPGHIGWQGLGGG